MGRRLGIIAGTNKRLLALVLLQGATGLAAIAALVYVLTLAPRVEQIERRIVEVQRIVREVVHREVVPIGKLPEHGRPGPAPQARRRGPSRGGGALGKLPEVGRPGPV